MAMPSETGTAGLAKPFRQGHKNDFRDAYAIPEAVQRPSTRCVPVKTDDQFLQALGAISLGRPAAARAFLRCVANMALWLRDRWL
jgi:hypothetical protein